MAEGKHFWSFFKAGGVYQVKIESGDDIANIRDLDLKLWTALSCPVKGTNLDEKSLALIDCDKDGKIRASEIINVCEWVCSMLKDTNTLLKSCDLSIDNIRQDTAESKALYSSAKRIATNIGCGNILSVADFEKKLLYENTIFNADSIIIPESAQGNEFLKSLIEKIISFNLPLSDRSGKSGINAAMIDGFFSKIGDYCSWSKKVSEDKSIMFLGVDTQNAYKIYASVKDKIADYFLRCKVFVYDSNSKDALNASKESIAKAFSSPIANVKELEDLPLSQITDDSILDMQKGINPAWEAIMKDFCNLVLSKLNGASTKLSEKSFTKIDELFAPYSAWVSAKPNDFGDKLDLAYMQELLYANAKAKLLDLVDKDETLRGEYDAIVLVEKLVRLHRYLYEILTNFVSFKSFYEGKNDSSFQIGKLYIDQRVCNLCINVDDVAKHSALCALSYTYLLYCTCTRVGMPNKNIVAAVSSGDNENLIVGRNGVFYDKNGLDWDASVVKIIDNPVSISQAFWSPYKKCTKWVSEQIAKYANNADSKVQGDMQKAIATPSSAKKIDIGTVAALGVAVSGITATFGIILDAFFGLGWYIPLGVVGIILAISLPSMLIASLKLRQRNLGPLLDANGYAVNTRAKINIRFGSILTQTASLPKGAKRDSSDPYSPKHTVRNLFAFIVILTGLIYASWYYGAFVNYCPFLPQSSYMKAKEVKVKEDIVIKNAPQAEAVKK